MNCNNAAIDLVLPGELFNQMSCFKQRKGLGDQGPLWRKPTQGTQRVVQFPALVGQAKRAGDRPALGHPACNEQRRYRSRTNLRCTTKANKPKRFSLVIPDLPRACGQIAADQVFMHPAVYGATVDIPEPRMSLPK